MLRSGARPGFAIDPACRPTLEGEAKGSLLFDERPTADGQSKN
jgi:hypothetical protein